MIICDYKDKLNRRLVVGLGYFDSVHKGHEYLARHVEAMASRLGATPAIFTFVNNPFSVIGKDTKSIFTFDERVRRLENIGIEVVIGGVVDKQFFAMSADEFLENLTSGFDIVGFVSGTDYTYGAKASGNSLSLREYGKKHGIEVEIVDLMQFSGHKISSRDIRVLLEEGAIEEVNTLLSEPYSLRGVVKEGRHDGSKIGIPTANIDIDASILLLKRGVYSTTVKVGGKLYRAVTNVGAHPTFDDNRENIEPYILDFDGDIYGEEIVVTFYKYLRGVKKFASVEELKDVIKDNERTTREEVEL